MQRTQVPGRMTAQSASVERSSLMPWRACLGIARQGVAHA